MDTRHVARVFRWFHCLQKGKRTGHIDLGNIHLAAGHKTSPKDIKKRPGFPKGRGCPLYRKALEKFRVPPRCSVRTNPSHWAFRLSVKLVQTLSCRSVGNEGMKLEILFQQSSWMLHGGDSMSHSLPIAPASSCHGPSCRIYISVFASLVTGMSKLCTLSHWYVKMYPKSTGEKGSLLKTRRPPAS